MKRGISLLLCLTFLVVLIVPFKTDIEGKVKHKEVIEFSTAVAKLNESYNSSSKCEVPEFDAYGKEIAGAVKNRLIVKSENVNSEKAIDSITGIGYTIFQYESSVDMFKDYDRFCEQNITVQKDNVLYCREVQTDAVTDDSAWSYKESGAQFAKSFLSGVPYQASLEDVQSNVFIVAVMDSGVDLTHEAFSGRYIDNMVNFSSSGTAGSSADDNGHGTSVAGVVVNSTPDNVKIKPYKVLDKAGVCTASQVLATCEYILSERDKPDVVNMSFTGYSAEDAPIQNDAVERLVKAGITVCVAAGNDFVPASYASPSGNDKVITVSSYSQSGEFSNFSCYGKAVDICAPGENVYCPKMGGGWVYQNGTSFACPFVSAACCYALMQSAYNSPEKIKNIIKETAVYMGDNEKYYFGAGKLSIVNLIYGNSLDAPVPDNAGGAYKNSVDLSFSALEPEQSLYYTLDKTIPTLSNGTLYSQPITLSEDTLVTYALFDKYGYVSNIASQYYTVENIVDESDIQIDLNGKITACSTTYTNIVIPEKIYGITPTSVGDEVFKDSNITSITLPESISVLGRSCFENASKLENVVAHGVESFSGVSVFFNCAELRIADIPNLKKASDTAFYGCKKLHNVNFSDTLSSIETRMFENSGLLSADFSKASLSLSNAYHSLKGTPISYCDISGSETITDYMFADCRFLSELKCDGIKEINAYAFKNCNMLKAIDASNVERLYTNALDSSYFDVFYAPKCKTVSNGKSPFSKYSYIKVLDLPALTDKLCAKWMAFSTIEELYLDSVTEMFAACFTNTPKLSVLYLPNAKEFYAPYVNPLAVQTMINGNEIFKEKPPLETVWIPKAQIRSAKVELQNAGLFFAPSSDIVRLDIENAENNPTVVVSPDIWAINFGVANSSSFEVNVVSADRCSLNRDKNSYTFVPCNDVGFIRSSNGEYIYSVNNSQVGIPVDFVNDSWRVEFINKNREETLYQFALDLTNDNIINAKDYSLLQKSF